MNSVSPDENSVGTYHLSPREYWAAIRKAFEDGQRSGIASATIAHCARLDFHSGVCVFTPSQRVGPRIVGHAFEPDYFLGIVNPDVCGHTMGALVCGASREQHW